MPISCSETTPRRGKMRPDHPIHIASSLRWDIGRVECANANPFFPRDVLSSRRRSLVQIFAVMIFMTTTPSSRTVILPCKSYEIDRPFNRTSRHKVAVKIYHLEEISLDAACIDEKIQERETFQPPIYLFSLGFRVSGQRNFSTSS